MQKFDRIAWANDAALFNAAVQSGAIVERQVDRQPKQFLKVFTGEVETATTEHNVADAETTADEMVQWHAANRQVPPMVDRREL